MLRLGARVHSLRQEHGYATRIGPDNNTVYRLIELPNAKQIVMTLSAAPAVPAATAVPATAAEQQHDKDDDEDRFHV